MSRLSIDLYKKMYLIRRVEEKIQKHYAEDEMKTPMHMSMGEEAIVVGVCHALKQTDQVLGSYRSHGIYLAKSLETDRFFAEMYGKVSGTSKGKAGSMHLVLPEHGLICTSAIVASHIPVAVGVAFGNKIKKTGNVVTAFFGDGAIDEGVFWESINFACLRELPILFVCEDNNYAVHTAARDRHGYKNIAHVIKTFDCNVFESESTDVEEVHSIATAALEKMSKNGKPSFLYLKYYRYLEHVGVSTDFNAGYRSNEEFERWKVIDPVASQRKRLLALIPESELKNIEESVDSKVEHSLQIAKNAPFPDHGVLYEHVYA